MAIGILPFSLRKKKNLAAISVGSLEWPLGKPKNAQKLGDLTTADHIVVYPSSTRFLRPNTGLKCKISLVLTEPHAIHGKYYALLCILRKRFTFVICRYQKYADKFSNVLSTPVVDSWVASSYQRGNAEKTKACSLIASAKQNLDGHQLRHKLAHWIKDNQLHVDLLGKGFKVFDKKEDGLAPYRYSVIIENNQEQSYFTEKLVDCFLCDTMPIYWGCPDIEDHFQKDGMIICHTEEKVKSAIMNTHLALSEKQVASLAINKEIALNYSYLNERLAQLVETTSSLNPSAQP